MSVLVSKACMAACAALVLFAASGPQRAAPGAEAPRELDAASRAIGPGRILDHVTISPRTGSKAVRRRPRGKN